MVSSCGFQQKTLIIFQTAVRGVQTEASSGNCRLGVIKLGSFSLDVLLASANDYHHCRESTNVTTIIIERMKRNKRDEMKGKWRWEGHERQKKTGYLR